MAGAADMACKRTEWGRRTLCKSFGQPHAAPGREASARLQDSLMLVRAHALLHQASRRKDDRGRIIAEIEDYRVVRELVADLVAVGVEATVKPEVREVVQAVGALLKTG